jgi:hypothetical protein
VPTIPAAPAGSAETASRRPSHCAQIVYFVFQYVRENDQVLQFCSDVSAALPRLIGGGSRLSGEKPRLICLLSRVFRMSARCCAAQTRTAFG